MTKDEGQTLMRWAETPSDEGRKNAARKVLGIAQGRHARYIAAGGEKKKGNKAISRIQKLLNTIK